MRITNISEAKASLSRLIERVQNSDEPIIIGKAGRPVAVLSAYKASLIPRKLGGSWEGKVEIDDDFDLLPEDWIQSFHHSAILPHSDITPKKDEKRS